MSLILNVKKIILEKGMKKCIVAEKMGITPQQFSDMLNGRRVIKYNDVLSLCESMDVTPNELYGYDSQAAEKKER